MGALAKRLVDDVISELGDRSGFDGWFGNMDAETQKEIKLALEKAMDDRLDETRTKFAELVQYAKEFGGSLRSHNNFWLMVDYLKEMLER